MKSKERNKSAAHDFFDALRDGTKDCETAEELGDALGNALPSGIGDPVKRLLSDRAAVESLLVRFTGDKSIGKKLDAIYGTKPSEKRRKRK